jgi:hypothetical protein
MQYAIKIAMKSKIPPRFGYRNGLRFSLLGTLKFEAEDIFADETREMRVIFVSITRKEKRD